VSNLFSAENRVFLAEVFVSVAVLPSCLVFAFAFVALAFPRSTPQL